MLPKKIERLSCGTEKERTRAQVKVVSQLRQEYSLELLLKLAKLPRSSYYYTIGALKTPAKHEQERAAIRSICLDHRGRYGYRRVTLALRSKGYQINHKLVMKLMKIEGLTCQLRKKRYRSYKGLVGKTAPNLLNRDFKATQPNQKWATDVTEFKVFGKRFYFPPSWICSTAKWLVIV